jgi:hypothetical protein
MMRLRSRTGWLQGTCGYWARRPSGSWFTDSQMTVRLHSSASGLAARSSTPWRVAMSVARCAALMISSRSRASRRIADLRLGEDRITQSRMEGLPGAKIDRPDQHLLEFVGEVVDRPPQVDASAQHIQDVNVAVWPASPVATDPKTASSATPYLSHAALSASTSMLPRDDMQAAIPRRGAASRI